MLKYGNKEFRNLEEQVLKNQSDIAGFYETKLTLDEFGIKVVGVQTEAPEGVPGDEWEYGEAVLVSETGLEPYQMYIVTRHEEEGTIGKQWVNIGTFPKAGPQGPQGPQGEPGIGLPGPAGPAGREGKRGIQGLRGERGFQGERGERGERGETGATGTVFTIIARLTSTSQLPAITTQTPPTDGYLVMDDLYVQVGTAGSRIWTNVGPITEIGTDVTVGGQFQQTFNADTKRDVITYPYNVYTTDNLGNQSRQTYTANPTAGTIAYRTTGGQLKAQDPEQDNDLATKGYVDNKTSYIEHEIDFSSTETELVMDKGLIRKENGRIVISIQAHGVLSAGRDVFVTIPKSSILDIWDSLPVVNDEYLSSQTFSYSYGLGNTRTATSLCRTVDDNQIQIHFYMTAGTVKIITIQHTMYI